MPSGPEKSKVVDQFRSPFYFSPQTYSRAKCAQERFNVDQKEFYRWMEDSEIAEDQDSIRRAIRDAPEEKLREFIIQIWGRPYKLADFLRDREKLADVIFELKRQLRSKEKTMGKIEPADGPNSN